MPFEIKREEPEKKVIVYNPQQKTGRRFSMRKESITVIRRPYKYAYERRAR